MDSSLVQITFVITDSTCGALEELLDQSGINYFLNLETQSISAVLPHSDWCECESEIRAFADAQGVSLGVEPFVDTSWKSKWQETLSVVLLGERFSVVLPDSAHDGELPETRISLVLDPGESFGIGTHPTTAVMVTMLESLGEKLKNARVLDVGCGSGVLSIVAEKLGARECIGIDIDVHAVAIARENATRNRANRCTFTNESLDQLAGEFDCICCNIISSVQQELFPEMLDRLRSGGTILLSGVLDEEHQFFLEFLRTVRGRSTARVLRELSSVSSDAWRGYCARGE